MNTPTFFNADATFGISYVTGSQHLRLSLDFSKTVGDEITMVRTGERGTYPDETALQSAVLGGICQANREFEVTYYPSRIIYHYDGYDHRCGLASDAAYEIVKRLATVGAARFSPQEG